MPAPPDDVAPLLAAGQVLRHRIDGWLTAPGIDPVQVIVGDVTGSLSSDRIHRREAQCTVLGVDGGPLPAELTVRRGQSLWLAKQVMDPAGRWHEAPLGAFRVTRMARDGDRPWQVTGKSFECVLGRAKFLAKRDIPAMGAVSAVRLLVDEIFPDVPVTVAAGVEDESASKRTYDANTSWWDAIEDYALIAGGELWCPPGGGFTLGPVPDITTAEPDWFADDGANLVSRQVDWDEDRTANVVRVEDADTGSVGIAADLMAGSPTYVGDSGVRLVTGRRGAAGSEGYRILGDTLEVQAATTDAARRAAAARLRQLQARAGGVTFEVLDQPWADVYDIVGVRHRDGVTGHLITGLPLSGSSPGTVTPDSTA